jgi:metallophosphoesterase superfamily enzyme
MAVLYLYKAERLVIVGDLTHSTHNKELDLFIKWRKDFSSLHIDLVKGNHDILEDHWYSEADIKIHEWEMIIRDFQFRHEDKRNKDVEGPKTMYRFTGHVHPGVVLKGTGKQSLKFPCFYFGKEHAVLPAFSRFTGSYVVKATKGETVYAITPSEIIRLG